jgi:hypothetical protein
MPDLWVKSQFFFLEKKLLFLIKIGIWNPVHQRIKISWIINLFKIIKSYKTLSPILVLCWRNDFSVERDEMTIVQQIRLDEVKSGGSLFKYIITIDMERSTRTTITISQNSWSTSQVMLHDNILDYWTLYEQ